MKNIDMVDFTNMTNILTRSSDQIIGGVINFQGIYVWNKRSLDEINLDWGLSWIFTMYRIVYKYIKATNAFAIN